MTYSIVARDPETGEIGVAVQTALPGVGRLCPWAEAGIGAVATQALVRVSHGPSGLALMRNGHSAKDALRAVLAADEGRENRQIGMIDANGDVDSFTGENCIIYAGGRIGQQYAVQANMMARDTVPDAMAGAYEAATGPLVERMLAALRAAQAEGGDFRGTQSAALKIVGGALPKNDWDGVYYDVRVDDHSNPVEELARICNRMRSYVEMREAYALIEQGKSEEAMTIYQMAVTRDPEELQLRFSFALTLALNAGRDDLAGPVLHELAAQDAMWLEYYDRMVQARALGLGLSTERIQAVRALLS